MSICIYVEIRSQGFGLNSINLNACYITLILFFKDNIFLLSLHLHYNFRIAETRSILYWYFTICESNGAQTKILNYLPLKFQNFIDTYKNSNYEIVRICENICDAPMIKLRVNYTYTLSEFEEELLHVR